VLETEYSKKESGYYSNFREDIIPLCPLHVSKILEVGCGSGNTLAYLKENGYCDEVYGVEMFSDAAEIAENRVDNLYRSDIEKLNLPIVPGSIEVILCLDVLEHLVHPHKVVEYLHTLLSRNGIIIASIPNVRHYSVVFPLIFQNKWEYKERGVLDKTHLRFFTKQTVIELMTSSGLEIVSICNSPMSKKTKFLNMITFGIFRSFLSIQYLIKVSKSD
jgi:2-polyprenyl-3-methyl-5-hydroxy-6-metoxy-1,4-benzoquinol methylase